MVKEYLEKIRNELIDEKLNLESEHQNIRIKISENQKFVERLREEDEQNFDAFSPRKQNYTLRESIKKLEEEQQNYLEDSENIRQRLLKIYAKLDEIDSVIKIAMKQEAANNKSANNLLEEKDIMKLKLLETQENERQRIARELHDSSVQSLTSLVHKTELCSKLVELDPIRCKLELSSMSKTLREIIEEMRKMIYNLRPMSFDDIGFDVTLERSLSEIRNQGINTSYSIEGEPYDLNPVVALTLLRVIKEACNNSLKHAEADMISVKICYEPEFLKVVVKDNGKGFLVSEQNDIRDDYSGFGLSTMRERICLLSGDLQIYSEIGGGTEVMIEVPIEKKEE